MMVGEAAQSSHQRAEANFALLLTLGFCCLGEQSL